MSLSQHGNAMYGNINPKHVLKKVGRPTQLFSNSSLCKNCIMFERSKLRCEAKPTV